MLRALPLSSDPNLLVGFDTRDDAGVYLLPDGKALVQTLDFFTPVVDDPYWYGAIAAANALSDVFAMGGTPLTVMNIACFDPTMAPPEVWAAVLKGAYDKTTEAGAVVVGGHSVEDKEPKFGLSVTGLVDPSKVLSNKNARPGDDIWLSKPLGTGIITTAHKQDLCLPEELDMAVATMATLNRGAMEAAHAVGATCATDVTGFGLAGHLFNIARGSEVAIEIDSASLPLLLGVERLIALGCTTGGARKNRLFLGDALSFGSNVPDWLGHVILDPQTSGGLAVCSREPVEGSVRIGRVLSGPPAIQVT